MSNHYEIQLRYNIVYNILKFIKMTEIAHNIESTNVDFQDYILNFMNTILYNDMILWSIHHNYRNINGDNSLRYNLFGNYTSYIISNIIKKNIPVNYNLLKQDLYNLIIREEQHYKL